VPQQVLQHLGVIHMSKQLLLPVVQGSCTLDKLLPLGRNDQFTKLMGDPNKLQEGL
jgi:hypothetical protein